jgi:ribosome maturation protein Sdo1
LATRSRLRAANEREVDRNRADQERDRAAVDEVGRRPWRENARLRMLNAKTKTLLSYVDRHCFPPESNSTPIPPIETGSSS